jgi:hypothetical protein
MEPNVQTTSPASTRSIGMKWGLYSALVGVALFLIAAIVGMNPFSGPLNWAGLVFVIVFMVLAHKNFKDAGDGFMSYGQGVGIGFWFTLVSTVVTVLIMFVYAGIIDPSVMEAMYNEQQAQMEAQGQSDEAIEMAMTWTKKLFWVFAVIGSIFWGMIIALILTIFTQKKAPDHNY